MKKKQQKKSSPEIQSKCEVRKTRKYGKGVFATENIKKGEIIRFFDGEIISRSECIRRISLGKLGNDDALPIGNKQYIILDPLSFLFNHSCNPNSGFRNRSDLYAIKNIKKEEEIVYDYSTTVGGDTPPELWTMKCRCGSNNCRKKLSYVFSIPPGQIKKYLRLGAFQDHIIKELNNSKINNKK